MTRSQVPRIAAVALLMSLLAGCASLGQNPRDPLEPINRKVAMFNEDVDALVLKPAATAYREGVPPLVRTGVSNFFNNLWDLWSAGNSLLQFKLQDAEENLARFQINTVAGVFGVFDVASDLNIERHREDFGQTLGRWGVPSGPYLVLPVFGPSTLRDGTALIVDYRGDLLRYVRPIAVRNVMYGVRAVDVRANLLRVGNVVEGAALDKYSFTRDAYLQKRNADIFDGAPPKDGQEKDDGQIPQLDEPGDGAAPAGQPAAPQPPASSTR